jgi:hypothetical protein
VQHFNNNYVNTAQLKELMTAPPTSAKQYALVIRNRIRNRRMLEEAKELKKAQREPY